VRRIVLAGSHHWWRWVAGVVVLVVVAFLGAAWYLSGRVYSGPLASTPFTYPPALDEYGSSLSPTDA
jgi:hypothetical protein